MYLSNIKIGIVLIILSGCFVAVGQLFWKIAGDNFLLLLSGFILYAIGALLMTVSYKYGEVSILQPMISFSYILSFILGYFILGEDMNLQKILGIIFIIFGIVVLGRKHEQVYG